MLLFVRALPFSSVAAWTRTDCAILRLTKTLPKTKVDQFRLNLSPVPLLTFSDSFSADLTVFVMIKELLSS